MLPRRATRSTHLPRGRERCTFSFIFWQIYTYFLSFFGKYINLFLSSRSTRLSRGCERAPRRENQPRLRPLRYSESERRGHNLQRFTWKPRPDSGLDCLICAIFARQRRCERAPRRQPRLRSLRYWAFYYLRLQVCLVIYDSG